jgi:flavin-dependent dehydrogenase
MARGRFGYVGLVRLEDGRLDIAAACDPMFVQACRGPGNAVRRLLDEVGWPCPASVVECAWRGTPLLTRRPQRLGAHRLFLIGDAAGYVEPFTGEGIAWALASGAAVAPLAVRAARGWDPSFMAQWTTAHARLIQRRQRTCRLVSGVLRRADITAGMVNVLSRMPYLARPVMRALNAPFQIPALS